jgi:hypothetical protein
VGWVGGAGNSRQRGLHVSILTFAANVGVDCGRTVLRRGVAGGAVWAVSGRGVGNFWCRHDSVVRQNMQSRREASLRRLQSLVGVDGESAG